MDVRGKKILITGASRGIGKAIALKLAAAGGHIAFITIGSTDAEIADIESALQAWGGDAKGWRIDVSDFNAVDQSVQEVIQSFNGLDVLINNAGITRDNLLLRMTEADWHRVVEVNLTAAFYTVKAVMKTLLKQRSGSIINISSVVGIKGHVGQANYAASKAGLIGFTKSMALELGSRNIRVNAIAPGFIATDMTQELSKSVQEKWQQHIPLNRVGLPEDVANCALFLASDFSSYITGQVIQVDGGMYT